MSQDEFTKLFTHMNKRFDAIEKQLENTATKGELNTLTNAVDAYAKQVETYMQEMLALAHKVDRMEKWIHQVAQATGVKLEY